MKTKQEITLEKIKSIKEKAEDYISEIIIILEKETGCLCDDIKIYTDYEKETDEEKRDSIEVDLSLRIPFRVFKKQ